MEKNNGNSGGVCTDNLISFNTRRYSTEFFFFIYHRVLVTNTFKPINQKTKIAKDSKSEVGSRKSEVGKLSEDSSNKYINKNLETVKHG